MIMLRTAQMMIFSLVAMIGMEKCCITSAYLQWLCPAFANSVDPDQLASEEANLSGSALPFSI